VCAGISHATFNFRQNEILARQNKQMAPIEQMFYSSMMRQDSDKTSQIQILKFTFPKMMMKK